MTVASAWGRLKTVDRRVRQTAVMNLTPCGRYGYGCTPQARLGTYNIASRPALCFYAMRAVGDVGKIFSASSIETSITTLT